VPKGFRPALERAGALVYRILYFEREAGGAFKSAAEYPRNALVAASNHDLPTLAGWWAGNDLAWRERLALFPSAALRDAQLAERAVDRTRLARALGISSADAPAEAAHAFLARTPSFMLLVQLEDVLGEHEQANLPGTVLEHPNWRRKLSATLEEMERDPRVARLCATLSQERS
jgi:4-alpha-glucanotransferase